MTGEKKADPTLSRRALLFRTGLIAGAAYVAPVMLGLNAAHASGASGGKSGGGSRGGRSGAGRGGRSAASRGRRSAPSRGKRSVASRRKSAWRIRFGG